jgi:hypothetical protein
MRRRKEGVVYGVCETAGRFCIDRVGVIATGKVAVEGICSGGVTG